MTLSRVPAWCVGVFTFVALTTASLWNYFPPLAEHQQLTVTFDAPRTGVSEPLVVTGHPGFAEFLFVKYLDETTAVFGYDAWGSGGPTSQPVKIKRGQPHRLDLQFPALTLTVGTAARAAERLRLIIDDATVLDTPVGLRIRRSQRVWFGQNPVGGSSCGPEFSGRIVAADGRRWVGGARQLFTRGERLAGWLNYGRWQVFAVIAASGFAAWAWSRRQWPRLALDPRAAWRAHGIFAIVAAICVALFALLVNWPGAWPPYPNRWGAFYDFQALSFLQGRLDVPADAIYSEAFLYRGKIYGYFGPTPALLRLPFVIFGLAFGELTRAALVTYFAGGLVAAYALLRHAFSLVHPTRPQPPAWMIVLFTLHVGLGSSLFFVGNRAQVFHEAILSGAMFALFTCWCALRHLAAPGGRWWIGALLCGVAAVNARPPSGLFALAFVGFVAAALVWRTWRETGNTSALRRPLALGVGAVLGFATFNAVSYLKFERFEGLPLKYHSQYPPERMAKVGHGGLHLSNLPHGVYTYAIRPNFRFESGFPWLVAESRTLRHVFPNTFTELPDPTVPVTYVMPALCLLACGAGLWARGEAASLRLPIAVTWLALTPMALVLFAAIGSTHRYTADFCPFLICAASLGLAALDAAASTARRIAIMLLAALTAWACVANPLLALHAQGESDWVPPEAVERYRAFRRHVDGWFTP